MKCAHLFLNRAVAGAVSSISSCGPRMVTACAAEPRFWRTVKVRNRSAPSQKKLCSNPKVVLKLKTVNNSKKTKDFEWRLSKNCSSACNSCTFKLAGASTI